MIKISNPDVLVSLFGSCHVIYPYIQCSNQEKREGWAKLGYACGYWRAAAAKQVLYKCPASLQIIINRVHIPIKKIPQQQLFTYCCHAGKTVIPPLPV